MNILERSLLLGTEIKKTKLALKLKDNKILAENSINNLDWSLFSQASIREHGYNKFPIALEIIKANKENHKVFIRESVKRILKSKEIISFCENMYKFKQIINEIIYSVSQPYFLENNALFENQEIEREYRKFYVDFIRLGIVQKLLSYKVYRNFNNGIKRIESLNKNINHLHFWDEEVKDEINKVCFSFEERKILTVSNMLTSIIALIEQVIYENHFNMVIFLDITDLQKYNKNESNIEGLMEFELELGANTIDISDGWIIFLQNKEYLETLLITTKTFELAEEQKTIFKGVIYPNDDKAFINKYIDNIK
ncbi:hypothetical protein BFS07_03970 [Clostridium perfringens]|uniref:hypothetical protein n=1 Tax=Clostridium perfringens TaxID=1502 RepID=UPI00103CFEC7|nr:hypothetical protein [Clostridium perfringens]TBX09875.1 hypothetical protein BFS07_03970 [Clostridium perfringens]